LETPILTTFLDDDPVQNIALSSKKFTSSLNTIAGLIQFGVEGRLE
jgi:hypothetical protein